MQIEPRAILKSLCDSIRQAVKAARDQSCVESHRHVSEGAWSCAGQHLVEFLLDLFKEAHRLRKVSFASIITDANMRSAYEHLVSNPPRRRALVLLTGVGGVLLGGAFSGTYALLAVPVPVPLEKGLILSVVGLALGGGFMFVWGMMKQ